MADQHDKPQSGFEPLEFGRQWAEMALKTQKAMAAMAQSAGKAPDQTPIVMSRDAYGTFARMMGNLMLDPVSLGKSQMDLWQRHVDLWQDLLTPKDKDAAAAPAPKSRDRRFRNEEWESNIALNALMRSYLIGSDWLRTLIKDSSLDTGTKRKAAFFTEQVIDAAAPTNFPLTNPDVVKKAIETGGMSLVQGYSNLLDDLLAGSGHIRRADGEAFELGVNIAATKGSVVLRTDMMELIQYEPTTEKVKSIPLLLVSPWVNKYYLFDLQQKSSFIKWAVDEGFTVFAISWVNPDASHADKDFENYWMEGPMAAFEAIRKATGQDKVNMFGYCLGGTLTASGLAYLAAKGDKTVNSATMCATMTDFADFGDFEVFVTDESVALMRSQLKDKGYLDEADLSRLFSLLRANDLIWSSAISSYLLAEKPVASDLLYWFSDGIGMPAKMLDTFMRDIILNNALGNAGSMKIDGQPVDIKKIRTPLCFVSLKDDHVANWKATYRGALRFEAPKRFILGGSGHNAGTINPPAAKKHGYWTNDKFPPEADEWLAAATRHEGSWWTEWANWLKAQDKNDVPARKLADGPLKVLEAAPGSYAKTRR
ncbi:alpha/beta fold hydrolase [Salmonella enterica subsp. enterica]|nr:alpha/beta fold hydrolase [Salmonella enterica subsp. enterica serovar Enteritidis]